MIHIIDPAIWAATGRPATDIHTILSERHMRSASLVAERLPSGSYRVHKCRIKTPPVSPVSWTELSALMTQEVMASMPAASLDPQDLFLECLRDGHRLLMRGDVMHKGDEVLCLHDRQWIPLPGGWDVGHPYDPKHWPPVRRKSVHIRATEQSP